MKTRRCYIYTRVSTSMQVDGYSLDAQKDKLKKYAEFQDMVVAGEYSDEGKSGKNIEGRPQFLQMLSQAKIRLNLSLYSNFPDSEEMQPMYLVPYSVCRILGSI